MFKRFIFLGVLTLVGITLLVAGWRGDFNNTAFIKPTAGHISQVDKNNAGQPEDKARGTAGKAAKPDTSPSGSAVQVEGEGAAKGTGEVNSKETGSFFVEYRLERERSRGHQINLLREIVNNANSDAESRKKAQEQLYQISNNLQRELEVESLIRAKGYQDSVVFLEGKTVTVVIQSKALNQEDAVKITDLVSRATGVSQQNIVIIPKS